MNNARAAATFEEITYSLSSASSGHEVRRGDVITRDLTIEFAVTNVNAADGEIGGVFVSSQASDTDLGSKTPKKVLSKGIFYGRITKE